MKKRNLLIILSMLMILMLVGCGGEKTSREYEYRIIENEQSQVMDTTKHSIVAVTDEKLNSEEIEELLNIIKEKEANASKNKDDIYIFLHDSELIVGYGLTLGSYTRNSDGEKVVAYNKDWEKQPSELDYKLNTKFSEKSMEEFDEEKIYKEISEEENIPLEEAKESISKVNNWLFMDVK